MKTKETLKRTPQKKSRKKRDVKKSLSSMSVDDFMQGGFDKSDDSDEETKPTIEKKKKKNKTTKLKKNGLKQGSKEIPENVDGSDNFSDASLNEDQSIMEKTKGMRKSESEEDVNDEETDWTSEKFSHKKAVAKLQKTDPEFYKFLVENDKDLLNFDESGSETEKDDEAKGGKFHELPESLEVASDESDFEDGPKKDRRLVTLRLVELWEIQLSVSKCFDTLKEVVHAFHAVAVRASNEDEPSARYVVTGGSVLNRVIKLCITHIQPVLKRFLKIPSGSRFDPTKNKAQWTKAKSIIKFYLTDILKLLDNITAPEFVAVILKHLHQMMPFAAHYVRLYRPLLKILVKLWSTGEETVRVIAFLCILRLTTLQQDKVLERVLKMMHLAYVRNCKFMSPSTLPGINFMRRSLVEIFALDLNFAYKFVFLYIRQLAIFMRNAIVVPNAANRLAVCNWQFLNSLHLWTELLGATANKPQLQSLIYPLVQITVGTINLRNTVMYVPLKFHCIKYLIYLSKRTCTFIPILPLILKALTICDFNKKHTEVSMKPMEFTFVLRATEAEVKQNGFKDAIIEKVYQLLLEYLVNESNSIAFPDLVLPTVIQLKKFVKGCEVANFCKKLKQLLDKIEENAQMIERERQKISFKLTDQKAIAAWETQRQLKGTPLSKFYEQWCTVNAVNESKKISQNDVLGDFKLPALKKRNPGGKEKPEGPVNLFPSDSEDEDGNMFPMESNENPSSLNQMKSNENPSSVSVKRKRDDRNDEAVDVERIARSNRSLWWGAPAAGEEDVVEDLQIEDL